MSRYLPHPGRTSRLRLPALVLVASGLLAAGPPLFPPAAAASSPALTLSVAPRPHQPTELVLVAHFQSSSPREGRGIAFFVVSRQFKQPTNVPIGSATTAADGTARLRYQPTWNGKQRFLAKLTGSDAVAPATADYRVTASTPGPLFAGANPDRPLAAVGDVFLDVILALVALVWLSLFVVLALALVRMPRLAKGGID